MSLADDAYDRGITALRAGDNPTAIASLLAAREEAPRDSEISGALDYARQAAGTTAHIEPPLPVTPGDAALLWVVVNVALAWIIAKRSRRVWRNAVAVAWAICALAWLTLRLMRPEYVVVAKPEIIGHAANDLESLERLRVHAGDELIVEEHRDDWLKVRSPQGERAYVVASDVLSVEASRQR